MIKYVFLNTKPKVLVQTKYKDNNVIFSTYHLYHTKYFYMYFPHLLHENMHTRELLLHIQGGVYPC